VSLLAPPRTVALPAELGGYDEILDVRAPCEYGLDHIPGAINLPVLDDEERAEVGRLDREVGPFEARRRGAALASANIARHLGGPLAGCGVRYRALVYCWRGGQRSLSLATVMAAVGWRVDVVEGGYKSYRRAVVSDLACLPGCFGFVVVQGPTGSGKTELLGALAAGGCQVLDLEGLARHRASVLGAVPGQEQPGQRWFETLLREDLRCFDPGRPIYVEAESRRVGKLHVPEGLWRAMTAGVVVQLAVAEELRVDFLMKEYRHLIDDPGLLLGRLALLERHVGKKTIERWAGQVGEGRHEDFVRDILERHYDPLYRKAPSYATAVGSVALAGRGESELARAAREVMEIGERALRERGR